MELWTEYEGRTIDGTFPLAKLLQPEGRSAFFSTPNGTGTPTVIRLIESHFDDEEILARWRGVEALHHPNLVKLKKFGQAELDGTALVYAVMEPAEANLGEIVQERRLTATETTQIATSLVAALEALHENGFVHEHVEPGNVLAVGEVIKLRSDCIRETPEGTEGEELKRRDVRDLAGVLLRSLTQQRSLEAAARDLPLAAPFDAIVRKGMSGEWGLTEIGSALNSGAVPLGGAGAAAAGVAVEQTASASAVASSSFSTDASVSSSSASSSMSGLGRSGALLRDLADGSGAGTGLKVVLGLSVLVLLLIAWHLFHSRPTERGSVTPSVPAAGVDTTASPAAVVHPKKPSAAMVAGASAAKGRAIVPESAPVVAAARAPVTSAVKAPAVRTPEVSSGGVPAPTKSAAAGGPVQWRVIAFTYNHEDQAQAKAARIRTAHPELGPEVFTPSGQAPYLVTIGGAMGRDDAYALARKAREDGLAHDTYAQNYRR